jgi:hypothetical protein
VHLRVFAVYWEEGRLARRGPEAGDFKCGYGDKPRMKGGENVPEWVDILAWRWWVEVACLMW